MSKFIGKTPALLKSELRPGDRVLIKTQNSVYELYTTDLKKFTVSGGVFECSEEKQVQTTVTGCTWGGTCVKFDAVAVCGLRLEFGNRVITSTISAFMVFKAYQLN